MAISTRRIAETKFQLPGNSLFVIETEPDPGKPFVNPLEGTRRVTLERPPGQRAGVEVLAGPKAAVACLRHEPSGCGIYFWGLAGHPGVSRADLPLWIFERIRAGDSTALRQIVGMFIAIIDDPASQRVQFVSDIMGLRPWFVGKQAGRLVAGSDVWAIHEAGLNAGGVNLDAVASWLRYAYDCTGQSLFTDYPHIGFGVIGTWESGEYRETPYATYTGGDHQPPLAELLENIHGGLSRSFNAVTRELDHVQIALSGGYDSRYLAALAAQRKDLKIEAFSVRDREAEGLAASMVAEALGLPLQILHADGSLWNMFDQPYHFTAGGFPMTKQLSYVAASQRPGVPCLNGFIGDPMIRGTLDRANQKLESETTEDLAVAFQRIHRQKHTHARFDLLNGDIVRHCDERTLAVWRRQMARWMHTGHPFVATSFFARQRHYLANNFLQHLDIAEAIVPFTAFDVIQYKFQNSPSCYTWETYEELFRKYFPQISHIPHNTKMGTKNALNQEDSRFTKQWAAQILWDVRQSGCLTVLNRRKSIPRLMGVLIGRRDLDAVALFGYRLLLLDQRLRRSGVGFDWSQI